MDIDGWLEDVGMVLFFFVFWVRVASDSYCFGLMMMGMVKRGFRIECTLQIGANRCGCGWDGHCRVGELGSSSFSSGSCSYSCLGWMFDVGEGNWSIPRRLHSSDWSGL